MKPPPNPTIEPQMLAANAAPNSSNAKRTGRSKIYRP
jgi:hypothetical protein